MLRRILTLVSSLEILPSMEDDQSVLIVLEGCDGIGKTTQSALLAEWLATVAAERTPPCPVRLLRFSEFVPEAYAMVKNLGFGHRDVAEILEGDQVAQSMAWLVLHAAFFRKLQRVHQEEGPSFFVLDRSVFTTFVYQWPKTNIPRRDVEAFLELASPMLREFTRGLHAITIVLSTLEEESEALVERMEEAGVQREAWDVDTEMQKGIQAQYAALGTSQKGIGRILSERLFYSSRFLPVRVNPMELPMGNQVKIREAFLAAL